MGCDGRLPEPTGEPRIASGDIAVRRARPRRYPWPVTPEQLSADHRRRPPGARRRRRRSACPTASPPRWWSSVRGSKEHGDYATNVALQLAKKAGHPTRATLAELLADAAARAPTAIAAVDVAGPGFLNITRRRPAPRAQVAADVVAAGAAYGRNETLAGRADQRGVHLGQPDRAAAPGPHPLGRGRRRDRAGCSTRPAPR